MDTSQDPTDDRAAEEPEPQEADSAEPDQGAGVGEPPPPAISRRQRMIARLEKLILVGGAVAALWLAWRAFGPQDCGCGGTKPKSETSIVAQQMGKEKGDTEVH